MWTGGLRVFILVYHSHLYLYRYGHALEETKIHLRGGWLQAVGAEHDGSG